MSKETIFSEDMSSEVKHHLKKLYKENKKSQKKVKKLENKLGYTKERVNEIVNLLRNEGITIDYVED